MNGENKPPRASVIAEDGTAVSFGEFLDQRKRASSKSIAAITKAAHVSRANYYLLLSNDQRPSLATAIALCSALGLHSEVPGNDELMSIDFRVHDGDQWWDVVFDWPEADRQRERDRFRRSATVGLSAAAGFPPWGLVAGAAGLGLLGGGVPGAAVAVSTLLEVMNTRRSRDQQRVATGEHDEAATAVPKEDLIEDFKATAEEMSVEDLQVLLEAMKALREGRISASGGVRELPRGSGA